MKIDNIKADNLSVLDLQEFNDVNAAIEFAKTFYPEYPLRVAKPILSKNPTSSEALAYAHMLEIYEKRVIEHDALMVEYNKTTKKVNSVIQNYICDEAGLDSVPAKAKDKVWEKAWSDGHSSGYYEVYIHLQELVKLFE